MANRLEAHILKLAKQARVAVIQDLDDPEMANGSPQDRTLHVGPIRDDRTYVIALHELGHAVTLDGKDDPVYDAKVRHYYSPDCPFENPVECFSDAEYRQYVQREIDADQWAYDHALYWSHTMQDAVRGQLQTYTGHRPQFNAMGARFLATLHTRS